MMGIALGLGIGNGGAPPVGAAYLAALSPSYSLTTPLVGDGDDWIDVALGIGGAANVTQVVAFTVPTDSANQLVNGDGTDWAAFTFTTGAGVIFQRVGGAGNYAQIAHPVGGGLHYLTTLFRGGQVTNAAKLRLWLDGTEKTGGDITHAGTIPAAVPAITAGRVGAATDDTLPMVGTIHGVWVYPTDQSANLAAIHAAVGSYLGL